MLAVDSAGEQKAGDVNAGNQQEYCDGAKQQIKCAGEIGLEHLIEGHDAKADVLWPAPRIGLNEVIEDRLQFGSSLSISYTRLQTSDKREVALSFHLTSVRDVNRQIHLPASPEKTRR